MNSPTPSASLRIGLAAALCTVCIWTTWIIGTRSAVHGQAHLPATLLAFIRFGVAALVLSPLWWKMRGYPRGLSPLTALGLMCAGLPYLLAVIWGLSWAPASDVGPLLPGTLPLFVAGLSALVLGERFSRLRLIGLGLIACGVAAIVGYSLLNATAGTWRGHLLILAGALSWGFYTIAFRKSGLSATAATSLIALWSTLVLLPVAWGDIIDGLQRYPWQVLLQQVVIQGLLAGILALICFATAVTHLGASRTSAITAITPVSATLVAVWLLGERPDVASLAGCALIVCGVLLASGVLDHRGR